MTSTLSAPDAPAELRIPGASRTLAGFVSSLHLEAIPASTVERAKVLMLDTLAAIVAGRDADGVPALRELAERWGGAAHAVVAGSRHRAPSHVAALLNATMGRALELDDVHEKAFAHPTIGVVPVALAVADRRGGVSGAEFLATCIAGIELCCRLSLAPTFVTSGVGYRRRGMSFTYQAGMLAGAAVAARLDGQQSEGVLNAMGIAYSQCAGNQQSITEGKLMVRVQQGLTAAAAVQSADFSAAGISGPEEPIEGRFGWYNTFFQGRFDPTPLHDGLGERFELEQVSIKAFPSCRNTHTAIAAALDVAGAGNLRVNDVARVVVHVDNREYASIVCEPLADKTDGDLLGGPDGVVAAQFSLPYTVAAALWRGRMSLAELKPDARRSTDLLALTRLVEPNITDGVSGERLVPTPSRVEVHLADGRVLSGENAIPPGHPQRPLSFGDVTAKLADCAQWPEVSLPDANRDRLVELVADLETVDDVRAISDQLAW